MSNANRWILIPALAMACLQGVGCSDHKLEDVKEENHTLQEQNDGLKRELDEANAELRDTKIALERSRADLVAAKAAK